MARRLISKAGGSAITTTEPTPPLSLFHWSNPTSMSNIQPSCSYQRRPAKHSIQQTYSASTYGSTLQDGYHPAHDQCTIMEKQTSLTVTQDMDGGSPDHETSAEKQWKQRVTLSGDTSRVDRHSQERESRAAKRSSKTKESPRAVQQPRNRTRVTVSSHATHMGPSSQVEASHCITVSRHWSINMVAHAQQQSDSRSQPRGRTKTELLAHKQGGSVPTNELREAEEMAAPQ